MAEQSGNVRLVVNGAVRPTPYLSVAPFGFSTGGERGLLSVVASPDSRTSGRLYVYYTAGDGDIRIDEVTRSAADAEVADPATRRNVLTIEHSSESNHNGGQMHFGSDGCLWVTTGDGGGGNDQHNNAQNTGALLGKILRIDPNPAGAAGPGCPATAGPPPSGDTTAPKLHARAPRRQRVLRHRGVVVYVRCNETCTVNAGGTLLALHRRVRLRAPTHDLRPDRGSGWSSAQGRAHGESCGGRSGDTAIRALCCGCGRAMPAGTSQRRSGAACASGASRRSRKRRSTGFVASSSARA